MTAELASAGVNSVGVITAIIIRQTTYSVGFAISLQLRRLHLDIVGLFGYKIVFAFLVWCQSI